MPIAADVMALVVDPMAKRVCSSTRAGFPSVVHAIAAREDDRVVLDDGDREPGDVPVAHGLRDVPVECREVGRGAGAALRLERAPRRRVRRER